METTALRRRRPKHSKEAIAELLSEFSGSGMTIAAFCAAKDIAPGSFHKWQSKCKAQYQNPAEPVAGFAELQVVPSADYVAAALFAEVKGIRIFQPVAASYLKELLS
jgi:hypothetical protein